MKKILITGANSYVGMSFENWLSQWPDRYHVDTIDMIDGSWREKSFAGYDVAFHVAGIAHIKETKENEHLYYEINRDLAVETAKKAKADGVSQFIFMSSMSVYGLDTGVITYATTPYPKTYYGKSKFEAERIIYALANSNFKIVILRPPMIYGKGCKGNYAKLARFAKWVPVFPDINNQRSMVYIDNLSEFIKKLVNENLCGIFLPQNRDYVCTSHLVKEIAKIHGKKIEIIKTLNPFVRLLQGRLTTFDKVFGDLTYGHSLWDCNTIGFIESIRKTEQ